MASLKENENAVLFISLESCLSVHRSFVSGSFGKQSSNIEVSCSQKTLLGGEKIIPLVIVLFVSTGKEKIALVYCGARIQGWHRVFGNGKAVSGCSMKNPPHQDDSCFLPFLHRVNRGSLCGD